MPFVQVRMAPPGFWQLANSSSMVVQFVETLHRLPGTFGQLEKLVGQGGTPCIVAAGGEAGARRLTASAVDPSGARHVSAVSTGSGEVAVGTESAAETAPARQMHTRDEYRNRVFMMDVLRGEAAGRRLPALALLGR